MRIDTIIGCCTLAHLYGIQDGYGTKPSVAEVKRAIKNAYAQGIIATTTKLDVAKILKEAGLTRLGSYKGNGGTVYLYGNLKKT